MKQWFTLFLLYIHALFWTSCSTFHKAAGDAPSVSGTAPRFMDDVVIDNGSSAVNFTQKKNIYGHKEERRRQQASEDDADAPLTHNGTLADFIQDWYGVPYRLGGTTKSGIDCSAFVQELYSDVYNVHLLRTAFEQFSTCTPIYDPDKLKEGDLVFFKIHSRHISHVGVYLSDGNFVHASSHGVMVSNLNDRYWMRYFAAGGRISS